MRDAPEPSAWLVSPIAERTASSLSLDVQRDALLDLARELRESSPATQDYPPQGQRAALIWAQDKMEALYAGGTAENIETMVELFDAVPDPQWRLRAVTTLRLLIKHARGEAEFGLPSPVAEMLVKLRTENARSANSKKVEQRQKRLMPYVKEMVRADPALKGAATIAAHLRHDESFMRKFKIGRRTLEDDVKAVMDAMAF